LRDAAVGADLAPWNGTKCCPDAKLKLRAAEIERHLAEVLRLSVEIARERLCVDLRNGRLVREDVLEAMSETRQPQGVLAICPLVTRPVADVLAVGARLAELDSRRGGVTGAVVGALSVTNVLAVVPVFLVGAVTREDKVLEDFEWSFNSVVALAVSCAAGVLMSYSQFLLRGLISATSFTVVGTMCKIATVVINCLIWDKHASFEGLVALFVCLFSGMAYQQAPLRIQK
jgi:hypothetical protein